MKRKTWILTIFCSLLLLLLPLAAAAQAPYSLTVSCRYGQEAVSGLELKLYLAGSLDEEGRFVPEEAFGLGGSARPAKWDTLADTLAVIAKDLPPLDARKTDARGIALFSDLEEGVYLVVAEDGKTRYIVQPFLAALPGRDAETWEDLENVDVYPKLRLRQTSDPGTPGKPSRLPQTGQDWQSLGVLALLGLGLCCAAVLTRRRTRRLTAILAGLCLLGALGVAGNNLHQSAEGGQQAGAVLDQLLPVVYANAQQPEPEQTQPMETEPVPVPEMPTQSISGWDYIGYLSIPSQDLTLPIQSRWSYEGLRVAPGRFYGSTYTSDLVLAAHNYPQHFGHIGELQPGDSVCFTDMDGHVTHYRVCALETLTPEDVDGMLSGDYDLTLFTCTRGGKSRVTVRCMEE